MNDKSIYIEQIVVLLKRYQSGLIANGEFNLLNSHIHAEYFLKQLLNHVWPTWKLKHTAEKFSHNTSSIDLFSEEQGLVVQVTAQKTNHREKIEGTIKKYNAAWKTNFPRLRIFFIKQASDDLVKEFETDKIKILSFNSILARIQSKFTVEEAYNLLEFIKQELGTTYGSPYTYERIDLFEEYKKGREHDVISNTSQYKNNLLFYSPSDIARVEKLKTALAKSKTATAYLEGPPCVGKTTLTFELSNQISNELVKTFYIDLTGYANNDTGIKKDIDRISVHDALLIIDNAQENFDLAKTIYGWLKKRQVRALFISRFTSNTQSSDSFSNYDFNEKVNLNEDVQDDNILKKKIEGIVQSRTKYLKSKYPQHKWIVKDIKQVFVNSELNFLKLSIILYFWEKNYQGFLLEQIRNDEIYSSFYDEHELENHKDETVYKYASLFKYDYPFHLANIDDHGTTQLIEKGVILKRRFYDHYFFPHIEYANLLAKAITYKRQYSEKREAEAIVQYIKEIKPKNIHVLINNLGSRNKGEIINQVFSSSDCSDFLNQHYHDSSVEPREIKMLFHFLNEFINDLSKPIIKAFLQNYLSEKQHSIFNLYEKAGYEAFQNSSQCISNYELETLQLSKFYLPKNSEIPKRVIGKSFFEITELLTSQVRDPKFTNILVNSFSFAEWKEMCENQPGFSLKAEGINNLRKNVLSRQLAVDLYNELDITYSFNQLKTAEIDVIGKALSDLSEFEAIDYKSKPKQILKLLFENGSLKDAVKCGVFKYSIGIAHLSKINTEIVEALIPTPTEIDVLFLNASANDFVQTVPLFVKHLPAHKASFIAPLKKAVSNPSFLSSDKNDLNGLTKLIELLSSPDYAFSNNEIKKLTELANKKVSKNESLVHLSDAVHKQKTKISEEEIYRLVSPERISNELHEDKISIKHLQSILIQNIKKVSPKIAYNIYTSISMDSLVKAAIATNSATPVSFEQLTNVFMLMYNLERTHLGKNNISNSFTAKWFLQLINKHYDDLNRKAKRASLYDFIMSYTRLVDIDKSLTERNFSQLLNSKSQNVATAEITLSNFSQAIRRLAALKGDGQINYKSLAETILQNGKQNLIRNAEHIDIGKISTGLQELSIEFKDYSETLFHDLRFVILDKGKKDAKRPDFINRVIPELTAAAGKNLDIINELKSYAK
jgi:hypothetical protein